YMAKVNDAKTTQTQGLRWLKIAHSGVLSGGKWASDETNANGGRYSFTIPRTLASGPVSARDEMIGLHVVSTVNGAQYYIYALTTLHSCTTVLEELLTGGGSSNPRWIFHPRYLFTTDPGILINIYYQPLTRYPIPGPSPISQIAPRIQSFDGL
ncbi:glycoside hydrolase, partial [Kalaharituber pfeilii]